MHLCVLIHSLLHVLQQVVIGSAFPLIDVDDAVQIGKVSVQIHALSITATHEPILNLSRLSGKQDVMIIHV